jgi:methionine--tRNA ligase beta chain
MTTFLQGENGTIQPREEPHDHRTEQLPTRVIKSMEELKNFQYPVETEDEDEDDSSATKQSETTASPAFADAAAASSADIDISKLDIRVGVIRKVWEHPEADKLYCEEIDLGEENGLRQIASGLKAHYLLEEMEGRKVLVLANLKARKLMGFPSHGMVLCASSDDGKVEFIDPPADAEVGERITVAGYDGEPATENQVMKKKMLDLIFPDLKTDGNGVATYKGVALETSSGACAAKSLKNVPIA